MTHIVHPYHFKPIKGLEERAESSNQFRKEIDRLLNQASLPPLKQVKFIAHGMDNDTYKLITESGNYILTLFDDTADGLNPSLIIQGSYLFTKHGFPLPKILSYGDVQYRQAFISTFLEGKVKNDWSISDYEQVGFFLGNLHKFSESLSNVVIDMPYILKLLFDYEKIASRIPAEFKRLKKDLLFLENHWPFHLPKGLIHGDIWYKNILFSSDSVAGVLDFTSPSYDCLILDLANLIKGIYFSLHEQNKVEKYEALLEYYQRARPLSSLEISSLDLIVQAKLLATVLYLLKKSIFHPEKKEECLKAALMNLLKLDEIKEISLKAKTAN